MTAPRNPDQLIRAFLDEGQAELPDQVYDAVRDRIEHTRQRVVIGPWRAPDMSKIVGFGAAAAAVVVAAFIGIQLLGDSNVVAPGPSATPTATGGPTAQPTAPAGPKNLAQTTDLDPGTYASGGGFPVQFDLTITDRWATWGANATINRIWKPCDPSPCTGYSAILSFEIVSNTFADPCEFVLGPEISDSVEDLVNAVTSLTGFEAGPVTDVSVDGYAGKSFELSFVGPLDESCADGTVQWLTGADRVSWGTEVLSQRVTVLDADGTRLVVDAVVYDGDMAEMETIIDSIDFH